jgi:hypothetical protein
MRTPEFQRNRQDSESRTSYGFSGCGCSTHGLKRNASVVTNFVGKVRLIVDMTKMALCNPRIARFSDTSEWRVVAAMLRS